MKFYFSLFAMLSVLFLPGCFPTIPPPGVTVVAPPTDVENPDKYRVDSATFPTFRVKERFEPPRWKAGTMESKYPMAPIETTDVWKVTHRLDEVYLIHADTYTDRQCRLLARMEPRGMAGGLIVSGGLKCSADYLYHIAITLDGAVKGSWKLLHNPDLVVLSRNRYINMQIDASQAADWGPQPLFEPIR